MAMPSYFETIYSIELSESLFQESAARFAGDVRVDLVQGDSALALPRVVKAIDGPALFWLDGHYSEGETARGPRDSPIREELAAVARSGNRGHVVLIDDARAFGIERDYPSLVEFHDLVAREFPLHRFAVKDDVIRITPVG